MARPAARLGTSRAARCRAGGPSERPHFVREQVLASAQPSAHLQRNPTRRDEGRVALC